MNHWLMIAIAYGLTLAAVAIEIVLLFRRRRVALRQARSWLDSDETAAPAGANAGASS
jgi:hypothetical protein